MISARPRLPGQFCGPTSPAARGTAGSRRFRRSARRARSATSFGRRRPTSTSPIYGLPVLKANDHIANTAVQKGRQGARALLGRRGAVRSNERQPRLPRLGGWAGRSKINRRCSGFNRARGEGRGLYVALTPRPHLGSSVGPTSRPRRPGRGLEAKRRTGREARSSAHE